MTCRNFTVNQTADFPRNDKPIESFTSSHELKAIVKWAGGKERELKYITPNLPTHFDNYYEPFVGGGSVYTSIKSKQAFINDKSQDLINIYRIIQSSKRNEFFDTLSEMVRNWKLLEQVVEDNKDMFVGGYKQYSQNLIDIASITSHVQDFISKNSTRFHAMFSSTLNYNTKHFIDEIEKNLVRKIKRMKEIELKKHMLSDPDILSNIETAFKSAFYMHVRHLQNSIDKYSIKTAFSAAIFLFIRNYAYSGMFRYNSKGEFNVPYGGIGYNNKNFNKKISYLKSTILQKHLENTTIECDDFEAFFEKYPPTQSDFIFLDPPYDSEFSTYAQNTFDREDQKRLANYLINKTSAQWMMIIKNTDFILDLYSNNNLNIEFFDKTYLVSFMNRNDKKTEHLLIRNY